jgi:hypothetical protein
MEIRFPDTLHVLDAGHPEHLDWRRVTFGIHQHLQNVHLYFVLRRKAGGRSISELARCRQFWGELDRIVEEFYRLIDPEFAQQEEPYHLLFQKVGSGLGDDGNRSPSMSFSFHADRLPNFFEFSNHQTLQARSIFSELAQRTKARRDRAIRL